MGIRVLEWLCSAQIWELVAGFVLGAKVYNYGLEDVAGGITAADLHRMPPDVSHVPLNHETIIWD